MTELWLPNRDRCYPPPLLPCLFSANKLIKAINSHLTQAITSRCYTNQYGFISATSLWWIHACVGEADILCKQVHQKQNSHTLPRSHIYRQSCVISLVSTWDRVTFFYCDLYPNFIVLHTRCATSGQYIQHLLLDFTSVDAIALPNRSVCVLAWNDSKASELAAKAINRAL